MLQPLHPDMRQRLDPRYVEIHDRDLQYRPMRVFHPWQPGFRDQPSPLARYDGPRYPTTTLDIGIEGACNIRAYRSPGVTGFVPAIVWCAGSEYFSVFVTTLMVVELTVTQAEWF